MLENGLTGIGNSSGHTKEYMIGGAEIQKYENEIKDLKTLLQSKDKKINQTQVMFDSTQEQLSQSRIEFFTVQKERDLSRFQLENIVGILKKREIFQDIMKEMHGYNRSQSDDTNMRMDIDDQRENNPQFDFIFGSSGPCILEEYQVKVEEQKRELNEKIQQIKQLQKDNEFLVQQAMQDTQNLETKEKEIERLKRSNNKLQKENVQIRNDQRRGAVVNKPAPSNAPSNTNPQQINQQFAPLSSFNTARRSTTAVHPSRTFGQGSTIGVSKKFYDTNNLVGGTQKQQEDWLTKELDYNLSHFNEMFIENLSQSLSSMLVLKKPKDQSANTTAALRLEEQNPLNQIQENDNEDIQENGVINMAGVNQDGNNLAEQDDSSDSGDEQNQDANNQEIEHILPQGEKEVQEVIESHEDTKIQDEEIKNQLFYQQTQIESLDDDLLEKERLLKAIKDSHKAMSQTLLETMKNEYHKKIQQFQSEMQQLEQERVEQLKKAGSDKQKSQLEEQYKKKLKELEDKLRDAKQKDREQTTMMKESNKQKLRIKSLEQEIEKMKTQRVTMMKRMKEESEQHRKWKADRVKEIMQMKQSNLKKDREIQLLKRENQRKDLLAKRKQEELQLLMKKSKLEKQKQQHVSKEKLRKSNLDINAIQQWIILNTDKMLNYKDLQQALEFELVQRKQVEDQIQEEQNQLAGLNVKKEKLEFKKCQLEQRQMNDQNDAETDEELYNIEENITKISYEMKSAQENVETLEEKFDFIDDKVAQLNIQIRDFSPDDIEQLKFDQVQSIEGARACLGAFFGILLDVNIYKKQLENQLSTDTATIDSLMQQMEELRKQLQASEINFQKQLESLSKEYKEKEDTMIRIIMENGGQELEQMLQNNMMNGDGKGHHILREYMKQNSAKVDDDTQNMFGLSGLGGPNGAVGTLNQNGVRRTTTTVNNKQMEIQKSKELNVNQSKTTLSKRVAELERKTKDDQKKYESLKHLYEQMNQEKDLFKKQLEQTRKKLKVQEVQEVKQSKMGPALDDASNYNSNQLQKSPRGLVQKQMTTLNDMRKDRKLKKLGSQNPAQVTKQPLTDPRVIADEPMEDDNDEMIFDKNLDLQKNANPFGSTNSFEPGQEQESTDVFTRLSQLGNKSKGAMNNSLNISQTLTQQQLQTQNGVIEKQVVIPQTNYEDDGKWKLHMAKEQAHNSQVCALASVGNQLYSTSNKSLRIWDLEKFQTVSDINAHSGLIKSVAVMNGQKILLTASDKTIILWDMISLTMAGKLTNHKEEIRAMTMSADDRYMFSAGKSTQNAYGLLIWDLRKYSHPVEEREKNQDIFSLVATDNTLFYGCRSHQVIPYNFISQEQYNAFEPPHFDAVTSLALLDDYLVSGSRDKMVRVWDHQKFSHVQVESAHNDLVNVLETDQDQKEMYSGCKDGVVKVWKMKQGKIRCLAQIQASIQAQSINSITKIDKQFGQMFATGSSDKSIRIWKKKQDGANNISNQENDDLDIDPFDKAQIDKNQDFYCDDICQDDYQLLSQINKQDEELKQSTTANVNSFPTQLHSDRQRSMTAQGYHSGSQSSQLQWQQQQQQQPQQQQQFAQQTQNYYLSNNLQQQQSKLEQKRRQKRMQDNQRKQYKENDQNFQI